MIETDTIREFWLYWIPMEVAALSQHAARNPRQNLGFSRDRSGLLVRERVQRSKDGWAKPQVNIWWDYDRESGTVEDRPLSEKQRERFTRILNAMESEGLVEIERTDNRRVAWVRLTEEGEAEASEIVTE